MRTALIYVFPALDPLKYIPAAKKFVSSYIQHPPGVQDHELHVIVNGDPSMPMPALQRLFAPLVPQFHRHNNWAKDLGAFMLAAQNIACDLLVCMGAHVNFWKAGWLDVITQSFSAIGPAVYAAWAFQEPLPHLRTTFWWCAPEILASYPHLTESDRYSFEHGPKSIALWSRKMGFEPFQITWNGAYSMPHWHALPLQEALARDQHSLRDFGE
jgi:hypothetical protein